MIDDRRGVLYPERLPQFHRLPPPADAAALVEWFWIPEWDLAPGRASRQDIVAYPALNLVVDAAGVTLSGATTRAGHRELRGRGWAVGALLRPAAAAAFAAEPTTLLDSEQQLDAPALHDAVCAAMLAGGEGYRERAAEAFAAWLTRCATPLDRVGLLANELSRLLMSDGTITTPEQVAARLAVSVRTLQRLAHRYVGLPPAAMIRRRRLQEAAQQIRAEPQTDLATVAAELGYADHAHLTNDFRAVLGITPSAYRGRSSAAASDTPAR